MYQRLGQATLKSGEIIEVGVIEGPDPEWRDRVNIFLDHKPDDFKFHIKLALDHVLDKLKTHFYVGLLGDTIVSQEMVVGDDKVGLLGHVYTHPNHRKKDAFRSIMRVQMADSAKRGYQIITLGTEFDSAAYWIYNKLGFEGVAPGCGVMKWEATEGATDRLFAVTATTVRPMQWQDWTYFNLLASLPVDPNEELPRTRTLSVKTVGDIEWSFLKLKVRMDQGYPIQALSLVNSNDQAVGWAILGPDPSWLGDAYYLDVHVHHAYIHRIPQLLDTIKWPDAPSATYVTNPNGIYFAAFAQSGFQSAVTLPKFLDLGERRDVHLLVRG